MSKENPTIPVCEYCGSDNVLCDAYACWDAERQRYEITGNHENWICQNEDCDESRGREIDVKWLAYTPELKARLAELADAEDDKEIHQ